MATYFYTWIILCVAYVYTNFLTYPKPKIYWRKLGEKCDQSINNPNIDKCEWGTVCGEGGFCTDDTTIPAEIWDPYNPVNPTVKTVASAESNVVVTKTVRKEPSTFDLVWGLFK